MEHFNNNNNILAYFAAVFVNDSPGKVEIRICYNLRRQTCAVIVFHGRISMP